MLTGGPLFRYLARIYWEVSAPIEPSPLRRAGPRRALARGPREHQGFALRRRPGDRRGLPFDLEVDDWSSPSSVFREISAKAPALEAMRESLRCAIDEEYSGWGDRLHEGAELAFIPPTAGG